MNFNTLLIPKKDKEEIVMAPVRYSWNGYECKDCGYTINSIIDPNSLFSINFNGTNFCPNCGAKRKF